MSNKAKYSELLKALTTEGLFSEEEAKEILKGVAEESEEQNDSESENKKEDESEEDLEKGCSYSDDEAKKLEKAMNDAKEKFEAYQAKKPKAKEDIQKSIDSKLENLFKSQEEAIEKAMGGLREEISSLKEENEMLKSQVDIIGKQTPDFKAFNTHAFIEKAMDGVKQGDKIFLSKNVPAHKEKIGNILLDIMNGLEKDSYIYKSLDTDLSNFVGGFGSISKTTLDYLENTKNIVIK